jgi:hypothetical protein
MTNFVFRQFVRLPFVVRTALIYGVLLTSTSPAWAQDIFRLWHGIGIQGQESQWYTEIDLRQAIPRVRYPSLKCSGEWQTLESGDGVYEYREVIKTGRDICVDGFVRVYLLSNKRMAVEYFEIKGGPMIAKAVVFPGRHHRGKQRHMIDVTRRFIELGVMM